MVAPDKRVVLHNAMITLMADPTLKIIYTPHDNMNIQYPCIVYELDRLGRTSSNNELYAMSHTYKVTFMSLIPGDKRAFNLLKLPGSLHIDTLVHNNIVNVIFRIVVI